MPARTVRKQERSAFLMEVYRRLLAAFGPQGWWPGEGGAFEVCAGAILTQSAAWTNAAKALTRLKEAGALSPRALDGMAEAEVAELVRSSGYFNAKARKLKAFSAHVCRWYDGDIHRLLARPLEELREELLGIHGVGEETADDMVLYAAGKPSFVVDAYTRRIFDRLGVTPPQDVGGEARGPGAGRRRVREHSYEAWRGLFMGSLAADAPLFNEYHALLVALGKDVCLKRKPRCDARPLADVCAVGRRRSLRDGCVGAGGGDGWDEGPKVDCSKGETGE